MDTYKRVPPLLGSRRVSLCVLLPDNQHKAVRMFQGIPRGRTGTVLQSRGFSASVRLGLLHSILCMYSYVWQLSKGAAKRA